MLPIPLHKIQLYTAETLPHTFMAALDTNNKVYTQYISFTLLGRVNGHDGEWETYVYSAHVQSSPFTHPVYLLPSSER